MKSKLSVKTSILKIFSVFQPVLRMKSGCKQIATRRSGFSSRLSYGKGSALLLACRSSTADLQCYLMANEKNGEEKSLLKHELYEIFKRCDISL